LTTARDTRREPRRARRRRRIAALTVAILLLAGAAAFGVWRWVYPRATPLASDWPALVIVLAGDGVSGFRDGAAARARFSDPFGVAVASDGTIYVTDAGDAPRIRRITPEGEVARFAGSERGYLDGSGTAARFDTPSGVAIDATGTLYVADTGNNAIRRIAPDGTVSTLAGGGGAGYRDGAGREALFNGPVGVAVDAAGRVIVADTYNDRVRAIAPDGSVTTLAGSGTPGALDGAALDAQLDTPCGVAVDAHGNVFVADTGNGAVRTISPSGIVSSVGPLPPYGFFRPTGIAVGADGLLYVTDDHGRIIEMTPGIDARIVAGSRPGFADGAGSDARFRSPSGVAVAASGRLIVADSRNALVRLVVARSRLELRLPPPPGINPRFDVEAFASKPLLWPLAPMDGPFEVTGTLGESRGSEGAERFHAGVDVHAVHGTLVVAVRDGVVTGPVATGEFGTLNEWMRIGALNYVHLRAGRYRDDELIDPARFVPTYDQTGRLVRVRLKRGARFSTGEPIGTTNAFNHVHLNVGWPGEEHNPLRFRLVQFEDTVPPTIARVRLFREDGQPVTMRRKGRLVVDGRVLVVVDAWDQADGNARRRRLGLYRLGYQVLEADGSPAPGFDAPRHTIEFDRLAAHDEAARMVYASGSGIPFYRRGRTRFLYVVTSTLRSGVASRGVWDTSELPPGDYTLRILASDLHGNEALRNRDVRITIPEAE